MSPATSDVLLYQSPDGQIQLDVQLDHDTVWLTQAQMSELFDISKKTTSEHIGNIFREDELSKEAVVRDFRTTAADGKAYRTNYYNLDVIISVGYRVKSKRGTSFWQWTFLFVYFLDRNGCLYRPDGSCRLADNALVALTLLIAESRPEDKDVMATLVVNLTNGEN